MFHSCQFRVSVMSSFFRPHKPYDDITMDDIRPPFHPSRYPTDSESDSDTQLTPTYSVESDPSESTYLTYSIGSYRLEPSQPSMICLSSSSFASSTSLAPPSVHSCGFICTCAVPEEEDVWMMHLVVSGMDTFCSMVDLDSACRADNENSPFCRQLQGYHFLLWHAWVVEISYVFSFVMYLVRYLIKPIVDIEPMTYHV